MIASVAAPQIFRAAADRRAAPGLHQHPQLQAAALSRHAAQFLADVQRRAQRRHQRASHQRQLDDGAILAQTESPIEKGESLDALIRRTKKRGAHLLSKTLLELEAGTVNELPNPAGEGSYFTFPTPADVREFRRRGYRLM